MDAEQKKFIKDEIQKQLNIILSGEVDSNTSMEEGIKNLFPGMPTIQKRPVMHPFGFVSRAINGIIQVVGKQGDHAGNRIVLGHRDKGRPSDIEQGELCIYSNGGLKIYVRNGKIEIGNAGSTENLVLGQELKSLLSALIQLIIEHRHIGNLGILTEPPSTVSAFQALKDSPVDDEKMLSDIAFTKKEK